jgi:hypothetical protein
MKIVRQCDAERSPILSPDGSVQRTIRLHIQNDHADPMPLQPLYQEVHPHGQRIYNTTDQEGNIDIGLTLQHVRDTFNLVIITILSGKKPIDAAEIQIPLEPTLQFQRLLDHPDKKAISSYIDRHGLENVNNVFILQEVYRAHEEKKDQQLLSDRKNNNTVSAVFLSLHVQMRKVYRQLFSL